jgi:hypothetical protein
MTDQTKDQRIPLLLPFSFLVVELSESKVEDTAKCQRVQLAQSGPDWSLKRKPDAVVSISLATSVQKQMKLVAVTL